DVARELYAEAKQHGISFVDGPVSGGEQGAINGQLTVMCGGDQDAYSKAETFINAFAKSCKRMGNTGSGQLTKMCNQIAIAGLVQGLAESIHFAQQAGLDPHNVIEVISKGAAQSWQMENRHKTMIANEYEHGFAVDWMRKDLGICLEEARRVAAKLPVTALVDQFYGDVQDMDGGRWDTSSLLTRLQKK
ncbi:NAD(P)-dependent oxidoreductase, partial [Oleiphilus sp. HI0079]|uniref:NAD(P)-dependent oxidoreductase n=2 Tax=Oleiphilus TaxID=141450 RepID=UPI000B00EA41